MSNDKSIRIFAQQANEIEVILTDEQVRSLARNRLLRAIGIPPWADAYLSKDGQNVLFDQEVYGHNRDLSTEILRPATDDDRAVFAALEILRRA